MKILAVGGGSMGRRRLRDLTHLNEGEVLLFEPVAERCAEVSGAFGVRGFTDFEAALQEAPDAVTISTPRALHAPYVRAAMERGLHVFAEVPFVLEEETLSEIAERATTYPSVLGISHTIRYYPPFRIIHDTIHSGVIGRPLYLEYSLGNYLPDWHPHEDYRKFYGSDAKLGGAGLDMLLHEISPILWWLGEIESVYARLSKVSPLEINGPDNHDAFFSFASGARGIFHHDIIERGTKGRHVRIAGENGTIEWHQNLPAVRVFYDGADHEISFEQAADWPEALQASCEVAEVIARQKVASGAMPPSGEARFNYESCYLREMRHFLDAAEGKSEYSMADVQQELQTLWTFSALLRSDQERCEVTVARNNS
jgi:predicted dehydrogenase